MFRLFKRKDHSEHNENMTIKKAYIEILGKYTTISSYEYIKNIKKPLAGEFINGFWCSTFWVSKGIYAIRFKDDMRPNEFNQIFEF